MTNTTTPHPSLLTALRSARILNVTALAMVVIYLFLLPGFTVLGDLRDPALASPGVPERARSLHRTLTPRIETWARERIDGARGADAYLYDVPTTEWPMFTAVFYLLGTETLEDDWAARGGRAEDEPMSYAAGAVDAARDLLLDPSHHTWVHTHWGDDYLHRENVFFRSLLISGLTSHERLTHDGSSLPMLRDQVETLARDLDQSELGLLHDYPDECYPIDVIAALGIIQRADAVLGTDHAAFLERSLRAFVGPARDELGLPMYRYDLDAQREVQASRGIGNSWILVFAPDLWPAQAEDWYGRYEDHFFRDEGWAAGFREFADGGELARYYGDWSFEIDAGLILDGLGTASSAFGLAAARRNGRFDHAYTLSSEMVAASWPLPDGTLLSARAFSHGVDAPYLGEVAIMYFLSVPPAEGVPIVRGGQLSGLVYGVLAVLFGVSLSTALYVAYTARQLRRPIRTRRPRLALGVALGATLLTAAAFLSGAYFFALVLALAGSLLPRGFAPAAREREPHPACLSRRGLRPLPPRE